MKTHYAMVQMDASAVPESQADMFLMCKSVKISDLPGFMADHLKRLASQEGVDLNDDHPVTCEIATSFKPFYTASTSFEVDI